MKPQSSQINSLRSPKEFFCEAITEIQQGLHVLCG